MPDQTVPDSEGITSQIWDMKYRLKGPDGTPVDRTLDDTWQRVAKAVAEAERVDARATWAERFHEAVQNHRFLPAGRILAGAGTTRKVTLFNCFVMGNIPDDMGGIFESLKEAALTMQQGGGIGYDFSSLRPAGAPVKGVGADASGPLSFMDVWDAMCRTIMSAGSRRGAMMGCLRCDHPDIEAFIAVKRDPARLRMFNLSVLVTDAFIESVKNDTAWDLVFNGKVYKTLPARSLWDKIMSATYDYAEPGVIFIDRINKRNNLYYCEDISATNPCGEQPLPPYGACLLGSVNLTKLVNDPFTENAEIDGQELDNLVRTAVRFMDDVIDVSGFPLEVQRQEAQAKRRIGLGVTGLADALIMCRARYGDARSLELTEEWLKQIQRSAYLASTELAVEKGAFPLYDEEAYLQSATVQDLDEDIRAAICENGMRNALVTSIAPTGTISLFAGNVSSGIEPVFSFIYERRVIMPDGHAVREELSDFAYRAYREQFGEDVALPEYFVNTMDLEPEDHLAVQAVAQKYVDSSISKTINCPQDISFDAFKDIYLRAYELGLKGCTTYRPNEVTGAILSPVVETVERERQPGLPLEEPAIEETAAAPTMELVPAGGEPAIVYMTKPLEREGVLEGRTYKLRWPDSDHAIYITLNDVVQNGRRRPFEIFINSKNMEHFAWTVALTRMISAVFRRGGDVSFVVEELKAVFDPRGGQWMEGRYVPSLLAAIGGVIERHMRDIGFLPSAEERPISGLAAAEVAGGQIPRAQELTRGPGRPCPRCSAPTYVRQEGCDTCRSCGFSKCV